MHTADAPSWSAPAIVGLGLLSAVLEGAGLYLFIPLLGQLGSEAAGNGRLAELLDRALAPVPEPWRIPLLVAGLFTSLALKNGVVHLNHWVTQFVNGRVAHRLRTRVLAQTVHSCVDYRVGNRRTDIANLISVHTWSVGAALLQVHRMLVCACTIGVFLALLMALSPPLTAIALAFLGLLAVAVTRVTRYAQAVGQQVAEQNKAFGMRMWESIMGLRLMRACAREGHELGRFEAESDTLRRRIVRMNVLWALPKPVAELAVALLIAVLILSGSWLALGLPTLAAFLALLYRMQTPVRELLSAGVAFEGGYAAVEDVAEFLERTREPYLSDGVRTFTALERGIELRGVGFRYAAGEAPALQGVSLHIPRGRTTAIVGRSGAGKSTLVELLFRFRDPTEGEILVDGAPLGALKVASWRGRLAIMTQDVHLFNDTVAANIAYGREGASAEDVRRAAEVAGAADFIAALPQGYDTPLGDAGVRLSGGQRQRIALARTILRDPDVLLLDEATNALDNESERAFQEALGRYARGRTVIVIAHRLSTIEDADQVVVMEGGRVVEAGPPATLLEENGAYARLLGAGFRGPEPRPDPPHPSGGVRANEGPAGEGAPNLL